MDRLAGALAALGGLVELGRASELMQLLERIHAESQAAVALAEELLTSAPALPDDAVLRAHANANALAELRGELRVVTRTGRAQVPTAAVLVAVSGLGREVRTLALALTQDAPDPAVVSAAGTARRDPRDAHAARLAGRCHRCGALSGVARWRGAAAMCAVDADAARPGDLAAATIHGGTASIPHRPDPTLVRYHRRRLMLWPEPYLIEELRVLAAMDAMAGLDEDEYAPDVVARSSADIAAQRAAIHEILAYRERHGVEVPEPSYGYDRASIEALKAARPIDAEVELLTTLRRSGASCRGACPLCPGVKNATTLAVWPERGTWRCWRCNVGGDVIAWAMAAQRVDFLGAVRYLAGVTGVTIERERPPAPRQPAARWGRWFQ